MKDDISFEKIKEVIDKSKHKENSELDERKKIYELDLKKLRDLFNNGEFLMLEYLRDFIPDSEEKLFIKVMDYNEIYANGWNINILYDMGKQDSYWKERADYFVKKYNILKKDYDKDFTEKYFEYRDKLIENLGLDEYLFSNDENFDKDGYTYSEIITNLSEIDDEESFTIARVMNFNHSVELHYYKGKAFIEYGERQDFEYWENEMIQVDWFSKDMDEEEIISKLESLFSEYKDHNYTTSFIDYGQYFEFN